MPDTPETNFEEVGADYLPGLLGIKFTSFGQGWVEAEVIFTYF